MLTSFHFRRCAGYHCSSAQGTGTYQHTRIHRQPRYDLIFFFLELQQKDLLTFWSLSAKRNGGNWIQYRSVWRQAESGWRVQRIDSPHRSRYRRHGCLYCQQVIDCFCQPKKTWEGANRSISLFGIRVGRPLHVQVAEMLVFPSAQGSSEIVHKNLWSPIHPIHQLATIPNCCPELLTWKKTNNS